MDEALFFLFSVVRLWTNSGFCYFYVFVRGRTTVFVVFRLSSMDEPCFYCFWLFARGRTTVSISFYWNFTARRASLRALPI